MVRIGFLNELLRRWLFVSETPFLFLKTTQMTVWTLFGICLRTCFRFLIGSFFFANVVRVLGLPKLLPFVEILLISPVPLMFLFCKLFWGFVNIHFWFRFTCLSFVLYCRRFACLLCEFALNFLGTTWANLFKCWTIVQWFCHISTINSPGGSDRPFVSSALSIGAD